MAFAAAGIIRGSTWAPAEEEKIKATIEGFGCTGGKIEKADYGYAVDDVIAKMDRSTRSSSIQSSS